jgi:hypothetical protein
MAKAAECNAVREPDLSGFQHHDFVRLPADSYLAGMLMQGKE